MLRLDKGTTQFNVAPSSADHVGRILKSLSFFLFPVRVYNKESDLIF